MFLMAHTAMVCNASKYAIRTAVFLSFDFSFLVRIHGSCVGRIGIKGRNLGYFNSHIIHISSFFSLYFLMSISLSVHTTCYIHGIFLSSDAAAISVCILRRKHICTHTLSCTFAPTTNPLQIIFASFGGSLVREGPGHIIL